MAKSVRCSDLHFVPTPVTLSVTTPEVDHKPLLALKNMQVCWYTPENVISAGLGILIKLRAAPSVPRIVKPVAEGEITVPLAKSKIAYAEPIYKLGVHSVQRRGHHQNSSFLLLAELHVVA